MYDRSAKGIDSNTWEGLMKEITKAELEATIKSAEGKKAPGYDGVTINLIKLLMEEPGPLGEILTILVNTAFSLRRLTTLMAESCHHNDSQERGRELDVEGERHAPYICAPRVWQDCVQDPRHSCG